MVTMVCCWRMLQWFSIDNITGYLQWKTRQHCREQSDSHWWSTLRFTPKHSLWKIHPRHSNIKNTCHKGSFQALSTSLKGLAKALSTKGLAKALSNYPPTPPYPHTQNNKNKTLNKFNRVREQLDMNTAIQTWIIYCNSSKAYVWHSHLSPNTPHKG